MKRTYVIFVLFFVFQLGYAQETNCAVKENLLAQYLKDKEYSKAIELFNDFKISCVTSSEKSFQLSLELQQYKIEIASKENKEKEVREILGLFKLYNKNFPNNTNGNFEKSAMALHLNNVGTDTEVYELLNKAFESQRKLFQNPEAIYTYFDLYFKNFKSNKTTTSTEQLFNKYTDVLSLLEYNSELFPEQANVYSRVLQSMQTLMKQYLLCDAMVLHAKNNLQNKKQDAYWLQAVAKMLSVSCKSNPVFESVASELHVLKPSSKSAYYLGIYNLSTAKQDKAITFFTESVQLEKDKLVKATTAYTIASVLSLSDKAKAKEMVITAIENNPSNGKYFIFLANLYANAVSECTTNEDEKNALYKLASDTVLKAVSVEPRLKNTAEELSKSYLQNTTKSKLKSITLGCWINQTVTF